MFSSQQNANQNVEMQTMLPHSPISRTFPVEHHGDEVYDDERELSPSPVQQQSERGDSHTNDEGFGSQSARWEPGRWHRFPFLSMLSLLAVLVCIAVALYILIASDGQSVNTWGYGTAPAVYLAITSVITQSLLSLALANGLVISFWRLALTSCTLSELNNNWESGYSLLGALFSGFGRGGKIPALACVFTVIGLLRGPLNQRASVVKSNVQYLVYGNVKINVAKQLPDGYTGISTAIRADVIATSRLTPVFSSIMQEYSSRSDIKLPLEYAVCGDFCKADIRGFGFYANCSISEYTTTLEDANVFMETSFATSTTIYPMNHNDSLSSYKAWVDTGVRLNATYLIDWDFDQEDYSFKLRYKSNICNLTPGTTVYNVVLKNGTVALEDRQKSGPFDKIKLESPSPDGFPTTIGGFQFAMAYLFDSKATLRFTGTVNSLTFQGSLANEMYVENGTDWNGYYNDPMQTMLNGIQEIALRTSVQAGKNHTRVGQYNTSQVVLYQGHESRTIYVTNKIYMAIAATVSILSLVAVAATFYGWWELGREMSMSPLEIAKAFDAPLLRQVGSNVPFKKMDSPALDVRVRYGEGLEKGGLGTGYERIQARGEISLGLRENAKRPQTGQHYGV